MDNWDNEDTSGEILRLDAVLYRQETIFCLLMLVTMGWVGGGRGTVFVHGHLEDDLPLSRGAEKMGSRGLGGGLSIEDEAGASPLAFLLAKVRVDVASVGRESGVAWV